MDQKIEFVMRSLNCQNFGELCREYGISRKTGYKWRERFFRGGSGGLHELSRKPKGHAEALTEETICEIVRLKQAHPAWGPVKIRELYRRKHPKATPSESSFKRVLDRAGLTEPRKRRPARESGRLCSGRKAQAPNEVWTVDFKGWWYGPDKARVEPLTVRDEFSRMILELRALESAKTEAVRECFARLFEAHGLPLAIRSDNGPPFASARGLLGLTRLSAEWLAMGIDLERGRPGQPQDNGAHERMHLDIRNELEAGRIGRDQDAFDQWREEFNTVRPHQALGMRCPAEVYEPSARLYEGLPERLDYGSMEARRVNQKGVICYRREGIFLSESLGGWDVGLAPIEDDLVEVRFASLMLGHLEPRTSSFRPLAHGNGVAVKEETVKTRKSSPAGEASPSGRGEACDKPEVSGLSCNLRTNPNV
jgi:transposase InsO family protein